MKIELLSDEEIKLLIKHAEKVYREYKERVLWDKTISSLRERVSELEDRSMRLHKEMVKILDDTKALLLTDYRSPFIKRVSVGKYNFRRTTNIKKIVFDFIKYKTEFRISYLRDKDIIDFVNYLIRRLTREDGQYKKLEERYEKVVNKMVELQERIKEREEEIFQKVVANSSLKNLVRNETQLTNLKWRLLMELKRRETVKESRLKKERDKERARFRNSWEKLYEKFKEYLKTKLSEKI